MFYLFLYIYREEIKDKSKYRIKEWRPGQYIEMKNMRTESSNGNPSNNCEMKWWRQNQDNTMSEYEDKIKLWKWEATTIPILVMQKVKNIQKINKLYIIREMINDVRVVVVIDVGC